MTPGWILGVIFFTTSVIGLFFLNREAGTRFGLCPFQAVTGMPCFLCGGTTASILLASGDPAAAFKTNPLVVVAISSFVLWTLLWLAFGIRAESTLPRPHQTVILVLCVALNWAYLMNRRKSGNEQGHYKGVMPPPPHGATMDPTKPTQRSNWASKTMFDGGKSSFLTKAQDSEAPASRSMPPSSHSTDSGPV